MSLTRRTFLGASGASFASLALPRGHLARAFAGEEERRPTLVVLFLRGGADALNVIVPHGDARYHELRPTLAIPAEGSHEGAGVIRLDDEFGLHPALAGLTPFWSTKQLAPIVNVGSPHPTRSHFDAQDFMEYAAPGLRTVREGWLNRFLAGGPVGGPAGLRGIAMQGLLPRSLRGPHSVLAVPERGVLDDGRLLDEFGPLYGGEPMPGAGMAGDERDSVLATGHDTLAALERLRALLGRGTGAEGGGYPRSRFAAALRDIARVIRADVGLEVAALDLIGWDTHAGQGGVEGTMAELLRNLGDSLAAFMSDLGPRRESTLVLAVSEFGRTCRENGNYGTDHGHGGVMLLLGGKAAGGRVHGRWTGLKEASLYQGRDLPVTTDFRDVFAEVLRSHMRFEVPDGFFPGYRPERVKSLLG